MIFNLSSPQLLSASVMPRNCLGSWRYHTHTVMENDFLVNYKYIGDFPQSFSCRAHFHLT